MDATFEHLEAGWRRGVEAEDHLQLVGAGDRLRGDVELEAAEVRRALRVGEPAAIGLLRVFVLLALGDVAHVADHVSDVRVVDEVGDGFLDPEHGPVVGDDAELAGRVVAELGDHVELGERALEVVGMDQVERAPADQVVGSPSEHGLSRRAGPRDRPVRIEVDDDFARAGHNRVALCLRRIDRKGGARDCGRPALERWAGDQQRGSRVSAIGRDLHGAVGRRGCEQCVGRRLRGARRRADGHLDSHFGSADLVRSADHVAEAADDARRLVAPEVGAHEQELVLGELTEPVGLAPHAQCPRCHLHEKILRSRERAVADGRDDVDLDVDDRQGLVGRRSCQRAVDESTGGPTVEEPGDRAAPRFLPEALLEELASGDILVEQHDAASVVHRSRRRLQPEPAILDRRRARILELE